MSPKVKIIPLADKGFVPISKTNRVRYYIESSDDNIQAIFYGRGFPSYEIAKKYAESKGMEVID